MSSHDHHHHSHVTASDAEFEAEKPKRMAESREHAKQLIDEMEGSFIVLGLTYDKDGNPDGQQKMVNIVGRPMEILAMTQVLHDESRDIIRDAIAHMDGEEGAMALIELLSAIIDHNPKEAKSDEKAAN